MLIILPTCYNHLSHKEIRYFFRKASLNRFVYLALCKVRGTLLRPDLARSGTQVAPIGLETDHFPSVGIDRQRFLGYRGKRG